MQNANEWWKFTKRSKQTVDSAKSKVNVFITFAYICNYLPKMDNTHTNTYTYIVTLFKVTVNDNFSMDKINNV